MGDDICKISSPNSHECASRVRMYFRIFENTPLNGNFLVFWPKKWDKVGIFWRRGGGSPK